MTHTHDIVIVSITGPSNAGKSQLAKRTAALLGGDVATRVPTDYFFVPRKPGQSLPDFFRQPLRWDWSRIGEILGLPLGAEVTTPDADFQRFVRLAERGGKAFTVRPVMLVDAMGAYPGADIVVRIDVPDTERVSRMQARDERWGSDVAAHWDHLEITWAAARREPHGVDLVLDGTQDLERNAEVLAALIRERMQGLSDESRALGAGGADPFDKLRAGSPSTDQE